MKSLALTLSVMMLACTLTTLAEEAPAVGKKPAIKPAPAAEKETIQKQVREQFHQLVSAIKQKDARAWSEFYSKDGFASALVNTDIYPARSAWVDTITSYFEKRESQSLEPVAVNVTPLASDIALMTSQEKGDIRLKTGETSKFTHVFTTVWKKEPSGWKIVHSHESIREEPVK